MRKIAVFTEGLTEQIFVTELVRFLASRENYFIRKEKLYGGRRFPTITIAVDADEGNESDCDFYFLIVDCATDSRVVTAINERYDGLVAEGFDTIIGVRDLAPTFSRDQLDRLLHGSMATLKSEPIPPLLVIAVMEAEAWFIAEYTHFTSISPTLERKKILEGAGIDVVSVDTHSIDGPALKLAQVYQLVGLDYGKSRADIDRTAKSLSYQHLSTDPVLARAESLRPLLNRLSEILQPELEPEGE